MADMIVGGLRIVTGIDNSDLQKGLTTAAQASGHFKKAVGQDMAEIERSMQRPEMAMKRLEASLKGDRLLASAGRLTDAIVKIGGASKLTESEQARANATLTKAIEKYKALGQEAPTAMKYIEAATRKATVATAAHTTSVDKMAAGMKGMGEIGRVAYDRIAAGERAVADKRDANARLLAGMSQAGREAAGSLNSFAGASTAGSRAVAALKGQVVQLAAGFGVATLIMRTADAIVGVGREAFVTAGRMTDMSAKTGLSTDTLQRLEFVADQAGGTLDNFTEAAFRLGVRLTSGSSAVNTAVAELGLNLADLKKLRPDEQLLKITEALHAVGNEQERNRIGVALFGKSYASIAAAVSQNMNQIAKDAKVMSAEQIKALDDAADAWGRFWNAVKIGSGSVIAGLLPPAASDPGRQRTRAIDRMSESERQELYRRWNSGEDLDVVIKALQDRNAQLDARDKARSGTAGSGRIASAKPFDLTADVKALDAAVAKLNKTQREQIDAAMILGEDALAQVKAEYQLSDEVLARYVQTQKAATKSTRDLTNEKQKEAEAFQRSLVSMAGTDKIEDAFDELKKLDALGKQGVAFSQLSAKEQERVNAVFKDAIDTYKRLAIQVPAEIQRAFDASRAAIGTVLDTSGLEGMVLDASGMFGPSLRSQLDQDMAFARAAATPRPDSRLDTSALKGLEVAADGAVVPFHDLDAALNELHDNLVRLERQQDPFRNWITAADVMSRSLDQAGLSVSRYIDSVMVAYGAGQQVSTGNNFADRAAGYVSGAGALVSATGSGNRASKILGGAASGAAFGSVVPGLGTAAGAVIGAGIGLARSFNYGVSKQEKEARTEFARWQQIVIANYEAMAIQQGRVTAGMTDWEKMVNAVADAYAVTGRNVEDVHRDLATLSDATRHSAAEVAEALERVNQALTEQQADVERLTAAMDKYGIALKDAGDAFQQKVLNASAKEFAEDFRVLVDSGMDPMKAAAAMAPQLSQFVQDTVAAGEALPSLLRPILDLASGQGLLFDDVGGQIDQLELQSMNWVDVIADGMDTIALKLDAVIDRLIRAGAQMLGLDPSLIDAATTSTAAGAVAKPKQFHFLGHTFTVPTQHDGGMVERNHSGAYIGSHGLPRSLFGRLAPDEQPRILQTGEGVTSRWATAMMGGRSWLDAVNRGDAAGAMSIMAPRMPDFDGMMANAVASVSRPPSAMLTPPPAIQGGGFRGLADRAELNFGAINVNVSGTNLSPQDIGVEVRRVLPAAMKQAIKFNDEGLETVMRNKFGKGR